MIHLQEEETNLKLQPNTTTYSFVVNAYEKAGSPKEAQRMFDLQCANTKAGNESALPDRHA